jgi:hypothetical protein
MAESSIILSNGHPYTIRVSGTFSFWSFDYWEQYGVCDGHAESSPMFPSEGGTNGMVGQDTFYFFSVPNGPWSTDLCNANNAPFPLRNFEFSNTGGLSYFAPDMPKGYNESHIYEFTVFGKNKTFLIRLSDDPYDDNYGQLKIEILP